MGGGKWFSNWCVIVINYAKEWHRFSLDQVIFLLVFSGSNVLSSFLEITEEEAFSTTV